MTSSLSEPDAYYEGANTALWVSRSYCVCDCRICWNVVWNRISRRETHRLRELKLMLSFTLLALTSQDEDIFQGVRNFFDSQAWGVVKNIFIFFLIVFWLSTAYWVYKDARRRVEDPWLIAIAVALGVFPPFLGPVIYLFFRPPEYLDDIRERELEIKAMEESIGRKEICPVCRDSIEEEYLACPVCTTRLKDSCSQCKRSLEPVWQICPYCEFPVDTSHSIGRSGV